MAEYGASRGWAWDPEPAEGDGPWMLERREGQEWRAVRRFGSAELARQALDQAVGSGQVEMEDLRVREA